MTGKEAGVPSRRTFTGLRPQPPAEYAEKGITNSGAEPDYEGCLFSDGTVVIRWLTEYRSHSVWASFDDWYQVHGHPEYGTRIMFDDGVVIDADHPYNPLFGPLSPIKPAPAGDPAATPAPWWPIV
jgi:hypothetical protein